MEDDSFMQIVRERLAGHDSRESQSSEGLFYNKTIVAGETFYVDMRKQPMRIYGYKEITGDKDTALEQSYVDNVLQDVKRELVSIGCDLKKHGFDSLPEPKQKEKPDTVPNILIAELHLEDLEHMIRDAKEKFKDHLILEKYSAMIVTKHGNIELKIQRPKIKKSDQKTVDSGFF